MGLVEVDVYDDNHIPLSGAKCQLFLKNPFNDALEDTKYTDSLGRAFLDLHQLFCLPNFYIYKISVTYGSETKTINNLFANFDCTLPVQTFIFTSVGGCPNGCPPGYVCVGNQCIATGGCAVDSDCATGFHCVNGQCQPIPGCSTSNPCPTGYSCVNGTCVKTSGGGGGGMWLVAGIAIVLGVAVIAATQEGGLI